MNMQGVIQKIRFNKASTAVSTQAPDLAMAHFASREAGHHAVAAAMSHMTTEVPELERLESERRAESKRTTKNQ